MGFSVAGIVEQWTRDRPDAPALTLDDTTLTWRQLSDRGAAVTGALHADRVGKDDRVAFLDKNGLTYF